MKLPRFLQFLQRKKIIVKQVSTKEAIASVKANSIGIPVNPNAVIAAIDEYDLVVDTYLNKIKKMNLTHISKKDNQVIIDRLSASVSNVQRFINERKEINDA